MKKIKVRIKQNDEYSCGNLRFVWGVKSKECMSPCPANLYTMNDIDIVYDTKKRVYILGVNSLYKFNTHKEEAQYLLKLLDYFSDFMKRHDYEMNDPYYYFEYAPRIVTASAYISELYTMFKIFVKGYEAVYGGKE